MGDFSWALEGTLLVVSWALGLLGPGADLAGL